MQMPDRSRASRPSVARSSSGQGQNSDNTLPPEATPAPVSENGTQPAGILQQPEEQPALFGGWQEVRIVRPPGKIWTVAQLSERTVLLGTWEPCHLLLVTCIMCCV